MPEISEQELRKQLAVGEPGPLYLLIGEEKYLLRRAAERLMDKSCGQAFPEFNRNELSGEAAVDSIADAALALPFMAEHKCVAVKDFNVEERPQQELDKLWELLDSPAETTTLVFWYPTLLFERKKSAKWRKFLEKAGKAGFVVEFRNREAGELKKLLEAESGKQGVSFSPKGLNKLLEYAGQDLNLLLGETEKLSAYAAGLGEREITPAMVEELTPKSTETTVFLMVNALVAGDYEKAYGLLDALLYQNEDPICILGAMSSSYVDMYRVKAALESGLTSQAPLEYGDYKNRAFRLRYAERDARGLSLETLKACLNLLLEADLALKSSRLEGRLILETLVARLLLTARGGKGQ